MRKVIIQMTLSIDGYFEGPNKEIDWHNVDATFNEQAIDMLNNADTLLFGRKIYELMASYWPTQDAMTNDSVVAERMNNLQKIVVSKTLEKAEWSNTRLVKTDAVEEVSRLKQLPGKNLMVGGSDFAASLTKAGLIDEYRFIISPIILGSGRTILNGIHERLKLELTKAEVHSSGNVILYYQKKN